MKLGKIALCLSAIVLATMTFCNLVKSYTTEYEEKYVEYTVKSGDTIWSIANDHYHLNKNDGICFEEFKFNVAEDNKKFQNRNRFLQVGDNLVIKYYVPKTEK